MPFFPSSYFFLVFFFVSLFSHHPFHYNAAALLFGRLAGAVDPCHHYHIALICACKIARVERTFLSARSTWSCNDDNGNDNQEQKRGRIYSFCVNKININTIELSANITRSSAGKRNISTQIKTMPNKTICNNQLSGNNRQWGTHKMSMKSWLVCVRRWACFQLNGLTKFLNNNKSRNDSTRYSYGIQTAWNARIAAMPNAQVIRMQSVPVDLPVFIGLHLNGFRYDTANSQF